MPSLSKHEGDAQVSYATVSLDDRVGGVVTAALAAGAAGAAGRSRGERAEAALGPRLGQR